MSDHKKHKKHMGEKRSQEFTEKNHWEKQSQSLYNFSAKREEMWDTDLVHHTSCQNTEKELYTILSVEDK